MKTSLFFAAVLFTMSLKAQVTTISFEYYRQVIFLKVKVNTADNLLFLFDTGSNRSVIDNRTSDFLNLQELEMLIIEGSAGIITAPLVKSETVSVGNSTVENIGFSKRDLSGSLTPPNQRLDGILGMDFFRHFVVTIDFISKQMTLSQEVTDTMSKSIPLELDNGIPRIKATLNDNILTFLRYDSGASFVDTEDIYLNITTPIFANLAKADSTLKPVTHFSAIGVGGQIILPVYRINSATLGSFEIKQPFVIVQPEKGYFARPDAVGFFGNNLMEKFQKVTLDFINKRAYFFISEL